MRVRFGADDDDDESLPQYLSLNILTDCKCQLFSVPYYGEGARNIS